MKYIISLFYPILIMLFFLYVYQFKSIKEIIKEKYKLIIIFMLISFILGNLFLFLHLRQEQYIYFWDFSGFWRKSVEFARMLDTNAFDSLKLVYDSMLYQEYSYFPEMFLALPMFLIGQTFPRFVISMFNFFVLPANLVLTIFVFWIQKQLLIKNKWFMCTALALIVLFTGNILPMKLGYIGSAGLPFIGFIMLTLISIDFEEIHIKESIFIGLNLVILVLIRRWFSYVAVSFFIAYPLSYLIDRITLMKIEVIKLRNIIFNMIVMGILSLLILVICFFPLIKTFVTYDYQLAYQSAKLGGYLYAWEWFTNFYSPLVTIIVLYGLLEGILNQKNRRFILFLSLSILIAILLFYRIQVFGSHHYYIINMYVLFIALFGLASLNKRLDLNFNIILTMFLIVAMISNFALVFNKREDNLLNNFFLKFQFLSTKLHYPPRYREDVDVIRDISTYLNYTPSEGELVYVLAGSANFTDDLLRNAWFPEKLNSVKNIEPTMQLDTRDGVPKLFFKYTYVVVANPIQYHNGEEFQRVIGILADGMLHDEELRKYYNLEKTFVIIDGIEVLIFKLIDDVPSSIIDRYKNKFKEIYPDYTFLYEFVY